MTILDDTLALIRQRQHMMNEPLLRPVSAEEVQLILAHREELGRAIYRSNLIPYTRNNELKGAIAAHLQFGPPELWIEQLCVYEPDVARTVLRIVKGIIYGKPSSRSQRK